MLGKICGRICVLFCLVVAGQQLSAQQATVGAQLFPESTTFFVEVSKPSALIDKIVNHQVRGKLEQLPAVQAALKQPQFLQGQLALALIETQVGGKWLPTLKELTEGGLFIGFDAKRQAVGMAFQSGDEELLKKTAGVVLGFIKNNEPEGQPAFQVADYRGGKVAEFDQLIVARFNDWFLVSSNKNLAREMADNLLDAKPGFAGTDRYKSMKASLDPDADVRATGDLQTVRQLNVASDLFRGATDEPGVELIFGGVLEALQETDVVQLAFTLNDQLARLSAQIPFDASGFNQSREYFFGAQGSGRAPQPIEIPDLVGQIGSFRDIGQWWLSKEELFPENVIAQLAQSDSQLSTLFGGMDFGQDVLGAIQPGLRVVVQRQTFDEAKPDIQLPGFALVGQLKDPAIERRLKISFQSVIGFININAGQNNYPQLDMTTTSEDGITLTSAEYLLEDQSRSGLMIYNFSPSIAFQDDYVVISSTRKLALDLAQATKKLSHASNTSESNTVLSVDAAMIRQALVDNRESLIAQSMLDGKNRQQASSEIELLFAALDYLRNASLDFKVQPQQMSLDLQVSFSQ